VTSEPRTEAGRDTFERWSDVVEDPDRLRADILAIEAEAAAGPRDMTLADALDDHRFNDGPGVDEHCGRDCADLIAARLEAAAGPRDATIAYWRDLYETAMKAVERLTAEAAAGPPAVCPVCKLGWDRHLAP
jgi:hypothetical protein